MTLIPINLIDNFYNWVNFDFYRENWTLCGKFSDKLTSLWISSKFERINNFENFSYQIEKK